MIAGDGIVALDAVVVAMVAVLGTARIVVKTIARVLVEEIVLVACLVDMVS